MSEVLDACCGSRMFWFDKKNEHAIFMDNRELNEVLCDGRSLVVSPDVVGDFRDMPFVDERFSLVVFDPPHLLKVGKNSWLAKKYGRLDKDTYKEDLAKGFNECMRVLKPDGVLIIKWSDIDMSTNELIQLFPGTPLFGDKTRANTRWIVYMKQ